MLDLTIPGLLAAVIALAVLVDRAVSLPAGPTKATRWIFTASAGAVALWTGTLLRGDADPWAARVLATAVIALLLSTAARWAAHRHTLVSTVQVGCVVAVTALTLGGGPAKVVLALVTLGWISLAGSLSTHLALTCTQARDVVRGPALKALLRTSGVAGGTIAIAPYCALPLFASDIWAAVSGPHTLPVWVGIVSAVLVAGLLPSVLAADRMSYAAFWVRAPLPLACTGAVLWAAGELWIAGEHAIVVALLGTSALWSMYRTAMWWWAGDLAADASPVGAQRWQRRQLAPAVDTVRVLFAVLAAVGVGGAL